MRTRTKSLDNQPETSVLSHCRALQLQLVKSEDETPVKHGYKGIFQEEQTRSVQLDKVE